MERRSGKGYIHLGMASQTTTNVRALDVAAYILKHVGGDMTAMKLQKLVYYCQAWSLAWDERPMFKEDIEAWVNGPVVRELYQLHKGQFRVDGSWAALANAKPERLDQDARDTIDAVIKFYGGKSAQWLTDLTHKERPWQRARRGHPDTEYSGAVIGHDLMAEYYGQLQTP